MLKMKYAKKMKYQKMKYEKKIKCVNNIIEMIIENLCSPAILYVAFSLTHIILDIFKNLYNTAFIKFIIMIIFTIVLNVLCKNGLGVVSWIIVFIPFISMTIVTSLLLMVLGLSPSTGSSSNSRDKPKKKKIEDFHKKPYEQGKL
jgi:hypothetical protein